MVERIEKLGCEVWNGSMKEDKEGKLTYRRERRVGDRLCDGESRLERSD